MFSRSRAHIFVRTDDHAAVVRAVHNELRRWDYRSVAEIPSWYEGARGTEVRELYLRVSGGWTVLLPEDLTDVFKTAYCVSVAMPQIPVVASRVYRHCDWDLKIYHDRDCLVKIGPDPDHELAWVGRGLEPDGVAAMSELLGGNPTFTDFLEDVLTERARPDDLVNGLGLLPLTQGFSEVADRPEGWTYYAWAHRDAGLP